MPKTKKIFFHKIGFTLIELLVALALFVVISLAAISIFVSTLQSQRRAFKEQDLQDNIRYLTEALAKEVRMSQMQSATGQWPTLNIINQYAKYVRYQFDNGTKKLLKCEGPNQAYCDNPSNMYPISSSDIAIDGQFLIRNNSLEQPRVTIIMQAKPAGETVPEIKIQNTITMR